MCLFWIKIGSVTTPLLEPKQSPAKHSALPMILVTTQRHKDHEIELASHFLCGVEAAVTITI